VAAPVAGPADAGPAEAVPPDAGPAAAAPTGPVPATPAAEPMRWQRSEPGAASSGWWWPPAAAFDRARLLVALDTLVAPGGPLVDAGLLRGKGVFRTERAWYAWQWSGGRTDVRESAWRADSRLELLAQRPIDPQVVDQAVRAAVPKG
jgi:hypothetical protein